MILSSLFYLYSNTQEKRRQEISSDMNQIYHEELAGYVILRSRSQ